MVSKQWRNQYDTVQDQLYGELAKTVNNDISLTEQAHAPDADLNVMIKRMNVKDGATLPAAASVTDPKYYGDFDTETDLRTALETTRTAQEHFNQLPADIRNKFNNDPAALWAFVNDATNDEESIKLGLLKRLTPQPEPKPEPITDTP